MTTAECIIALLTQYGFRWEAHAPGLKPLLTNIPAGQVSCTTCGKPGAQSATHKWYGTVICRSCAQQRARTYYHQRTQRHRRTP